MLPFRLFHHKGHIEYPLSLYSCGLHEQHRVHRAIGYPTFQCMICFGGAGTFDFENGSSLTMQRGDVLLVPGKLAHAYGPKAEGGWVLGYMGIEGRLIEPLIHSLELPLMQPIAVVSEHHMKQLETDLRQLWNGSEPDGRDSYDQQQASTQIYHMLTYIAAMTRSENPVSKDRSSAGVKTLLRESVQYMEQHYMEELSIANIADTVGYSKQHFQRKFKEIYGVNPNHYLQRLRLLKGEQLLAEQSELSVGEIAIRVGMEFNYFVRLFKREHGITPAQYRLTRAYE